MKKNKIKNNDEKDEFEVKMIEEKKIIKYRKKDLLDISMKKMNSRRAEMRKKKINNKIKKNKNTNI